MKLNTQNLIIKPNRLPHIPKVQGVYMLTCKATGKSYIGSSSNINYRCSTYTNSYKKNNTHLAELDFNNCEFTMLDNCKYLTKDQRLQLELEQIIKHDTIYPNGFNMRNPVTFKSFLPTKPKRIVTPSTVKAKQRKQHTNYGKQPSVYCNVIKY